MTNDGAINRLLYAILSQKCLKDIDWNKVAHDPILSQEITNGHAARMRYSRFKKQMDGMTSMPTRPRKIATPRRSRVEKNKFAKREPRINSRTDSLENMDLPFRLKSETQVVHPSSSTNMITTNMDHKVPLSTLHIAKFEPTTPITSHLKTKTESNLLIPFSTTPSESFHLQTSFPMDSPTSPNSPILSTPGVMMSLNSSMSSTASLDNCMMDTSLFSLPLYEQAEYKGSIGAGHRGELRCCFDPWNRDEGGFGNITSGVEDGDTIMVKRETCDDASYGFF
ncbi:hypothetical protein SBOR_9657 [Sclerotinia borealis F-4128]|uniref:Myb-like DNA-binding domain-containing protein n=1 Tax=Sclerotinia borealis (strain F-4128) TaxID=1432307 RepID=W9C2N1_SCLBF|nr:hypothetical protein SBOR_9657 [Sclerotinia borealis F-4128]